ACRTGRTPGAGVSRGGRHTRAFSSSRPLRPVRPGAAPGAAGRSPRSSRNRASEGPRGPGPRPGRRRGRRGRRRGLESTSGATSSVYPSCVTSAWSGCPVPMITKGTTPFRGTAAARSPASERAPPELVVANAVVAREAGLAGLVGELARAAEGDAAGHVAARAAGRDVRDVADARVGDAAEHAVARRAARLAGVLAGVVGRSLDAVEGAEADDVRGQDRREQTEALAAGFLRFLAFAPRRAARGRGVGAARGRARLRRVPGGRSRRGRSGLGSADAGEAHLAREAGRGARAPRAPRSLRPGLHAARPPPPER